MTTSNMEITMKSQDLLAKQLEKLAIAMIDEAYTYLESTLRVVLEESNQSQLCLRSDRIHTLTELMDTVPGLNEDVKQETVKLRNLLYTLTV